MKTLVLAHSAIKVFAFEPPDLLPGPRAEVSKAVQLF
jgi:hypothetical protein